MNTTKYYTSNMIETMNYDNTWNHCILKDKDLSNKNKEELYELHPTGYCDLNGRKYIALPKNINVNDVNIKKKYNLI